MMSTPLAILCSLLALPVLFGFLCLTIRFAEELIVVCIAGLFVAALAALTFLFQGGQPPHWVFVVALSALGCGFFGVIGSDAA